MADTIVGDLNAVGASYVFASGDGLDISGGISVANSFYVGINAPTGLGDGYVYSETGIGNPYTVSAAGNIFIGQGLEIADGYNLILNGVGANGVAFTAGNIEATGGLTFNNIGDIQVDQFVATGTGNVSINAQSWRSDVFQMDDSKNVTINLGTGEMSVTGSIENQSTGQLTINAGKLTAASIENADNSGYLLLDVQSLHLTGALINKGNFNATVKGETNIAGGVNKDSMPLTNGFRLVTGTLNLGTG
ncbi:MAG: hypothetical protein J5613_03860, partial [Alphaproteobacteria bacterium]|nr:hypothetical protein [Alphaproteobacteria bacterium]